MPYKHIILISRKYVLYATKWPMGVTGSLHCYYLSVDMVFGLTFIQPFFKEWQAEFGPKTRYHHVLLFVFFGLNLQ